MRKTIGALLVLAAVLFSVPGASMAKDYCLTFPTFGTQIFLVARGFTLPKKNTCKSLTGFDSGTAVTVNIAFTGAACTSSDASHMSITMTGSNAESGGGAFIGSVTLSLPAQSGTYNEEDINGSSVSSNGPYTVNGAPCKGSTIPAISSNSPHESLPNIAGLR